METLTVVKEIAIILLLVGAFGLCVVVAWGLVKLFPHLRRMVEQLGNTAEAASKIGGDFAVVSSDVAGDVRKTAASTAEAADGLVGMFPILRHTADNLANTTEATSKIAGNFTAVSADVASSVRKTAVSTAEGAEHFAQTGRNVINLFPHLRRVTENLATTAEAASKIGEDLAAVSADVAGDVRKVAASTAAGAERLATTAEAASKIGGDFAAISADVAGDVRKAAASTAAGAERLANTAGAASKIGGDFAAVSADVAGDVRKAAASTADGAKDFAQTARNLMESSGSLRTALQVVNLLVAAGGGVANIAQKGISQMPAQLRNVFSRVRPNS